MAASYVKESELVSFFVYNPQLGHKEGTEELKILYYCPEDEVVNRKVRNIGLCEALVNFTNTFHPDRPCEAVHTDRKRQVFLEPETGIWMVLTVSIPWVELVNNGETIVEYHEEHIQDSVLQAALQRSYDMFKLFNGQFEEIVAQFGLEVLKTRLKNFFSRYLQTVDVKQLDIFSVFQGIQFLPLDKYMYLKVHCFVNLVETTYRSIQRTVFLYGDQLVWSGLEQDDIKIFYQYLLTWFFPSFSSDSSYSSSSSSFNPLLSTSIFTPVAATPTTGSFILGGSGGIPGTSEVGKSPWIYVSIDGSCQSCRLYIYNLGSATMCFFVKSTVKNSPSSDFSKKLGSFLNPRLHQITREIGEFVSKSKAASQEQQYKFVYFNEMNLAVKSYLQGRRVPPHPSQLISPEAMTLITELNLEYDDLDEGETIMRTMSDFWVVCRKSGHRRFFVVLNQKNANFAEINDDIRRLCQKEFNNIFFLD